MTTEQQTSSPFIRPDGRALNELRPVRFQNHIAPHAHGSTLISWGNTQVICAVTIEPSVPRWMKEQNVAGGWLTAEYSMLPYSTHQRKGRDVNRGKIDGRTQEIQRLIGRSLRAAVDLKLLGERTLWIDCDVLQADGGTRTASITGSYVALQLAVQNLMKKGDLSQSPVIRQVAGVSLGIVQNSPCLDLCYLEDVAADVDLNLVVTDLAEFIEVQGTGEKACFKQSQLQQMLDLGQSGIRRLMSAQNQALQPSS